MMDEWFLLMQTNPLWFKIESDMIRKYIRNNEVFLLTEKLAEAWEMFRGIRLDSAKRWLMSRDL